MVIGQGLGEVRDSFLTENQAFIVLIMTEEKVEVKMERAEQLQRLIAGPHQRQVTVASDLLVEVVLNGVAAVAAVILVVLVVRRLTATFSEVAVHLSV